MEIYCGAVSDSDSISPACLRSLPLAWSLALSDWRETRGMGEGRNITRHSRLGGSTHTTSLSRGVRGGRRGRGGGGKGKSEADR